MNNQTLTLLRILSDPRVTTTPLRVMRELRKQGKPRIPTQVQEDLETGSKKHALGFMRSLLSGERITRHNKRWVVNSFLPPFPSRAYNRMFENLLSGRRLSPVSAFLALTSACPNNCWHCSIKNRRDSDLSTQQWLSIIEQLHGLGASIIGFTGGEPMLRSDLLELVRAAVSGGAEAIVFSSGANASKDSISQLADAGLWAFCVSLDHPDPATFDKMRGKPGAFKEAEQTLKWASDAGLYCMTGVLGSHEVIDNNMLPQIYEIAKSWGAHEMRIVEPMPCGNLHDTDDSTLLTPADIDQLRRFHIETNQHGKGPKVCAFNQIESPELFGCGAGTQHLFIDPEGEVCPCDFTPMSFGNVTSENIVDIWNRMTGALGNPRRNCFIQRHHKLIEKYANRQYPLPMADSLRVCEEAGTEPLSDYFAMVTGGSKGQPDD